MAKPCLQPRCPNPAEGRASFCVEHSPKPWEGKAHRRGHSGWQLSALKARVRRERGPWCQQCRTRPGEELDHIVGLAEGGAPLDPANVQLLCQTCHTEKTRTQQARGRVGPSPEAIGG